MHFLIARYNLDLNDVNVAFEDGQIDLLMESGDGLKWACQITRQ